MLISQNSAALFACYMAIVGHCLVAWLTDRGGATWHMGLCKIMVQGFECPRNKLEIVFFLIFVSMGRAETAEVT